MDPFWERVSWAILVAAFGAVAWVAKAIIKPWSDAALTKSNAFVAMVAVLERAIPDIHNQLSILTTASRLSNEELRKNTESAQDQTAETKKLREAFGSDPFKVCRAMTREEIIEIVNERQIELTDKQLEALIDRYIAEREKRAKPTG